MNKNKNRNKENKFGLIPIISTLLMVCALIIALAVFNMDSIMLHFAPKVYITSLVANTIKEIQNENEKKSEIYPSYHKIIDSNTIDFDGNIAGKNIKFSSSYNSQTPSLYTSGTYENIPFDGYITQNETGICVPQLMDVYFTLPTKTFGSEYNKSLTANFLPFNISDKLDLSLPKDENSQILTLDDIYNCISPFLNDIQVKKGSDDGEILITVPAENFKTAISDIAKTYKDNAEHSVFASFIAKFLEIDFSSSLFDVIISELDSLSSEDSVTFSCIQRKSHIVKFHTKIIAEEGIIDILADVSDVRMLDNVALKFEYESNSAKVALNYNSNGNFFYDTEDLYSEKNLTFDFGNSRLLTLKHSEHGDRKNRTGTVEIDSDTLGNTSVFAQYKSLLSSDKDEISISNLTINKKEVANADISLSDYEKIQIPSRDTYPLNDLDEQDLPFFANMLKNQNQ